MNIKHKDHIFVEIEKDSLWKEELPNEEIFILKFKLDWIIDYHLRNSSGTKHFKCNIKTNDLNTSINEVLEYRKVIYGYCKDE